MTPDEFAAFAAEWAPKKCGDETCVVCPEKAERFRAALAALIIPLTKEVEGLKELLEAAASKLRPMRYASTHHYLEHLAVLQRIEAALGTYEPDAKPEVK